MEETQKLALEAARRNALQKFGSYVRSEETLRRFSGERGDRETFVQETEVISASVIRLKEGSKEVARRTEGKTLRFVVRAEFEINKNKFTKRVEQYRSAPEESKVRQLVDRGVRLESKIREAEGTEELQRLTGERLELRRQIQQSLQRLDGSQALTDIGSQRDQRRRAARQHVRFIKNNLHPYSIAKVVPQSEPRVTDQGKYVEIKARYKVRLKKDPEWASAIGDTLRALTQRWHSEQGWNPIDLRLLQAKLGCAFVGESASGQVLFLKPGPAIDVDYSSWSLGSPPRPGTSSAREKAVTVSMYNTQDISTSRDGSVVEFEINLPPPIVRRLENINLVITHIQQGSRPSPAANLGGFAKGRGFERITNADPRPPGTPPRPMRTFVNRSGSETSVEDITIGDGFGKYLDVVKKSSEKETSLEEAMRQVPE
ncbi:uncharacterized protein YjiS (DUF1127 family) [Salinibacter ruber]|uniref:Uncharacterized protein YjiS (DUF1127 family) n=2 Tax=Salinibacter ruber TaxID=146919 RepID=A0AAW5PBH1_9BACT|nr:hypothetical protein [Salinibacter ruber]MCS4155757.1 uncharacterized protein YjiS (DUF1127 family) [Salinibacter ruber]MCS4159262.1 uncharacterized protein YjiS (DUF1127 family) [Salinibacter ruber]MCS4223746.1 uncharacterized protein YjiS (DUF1127 family) [Salinibacter ruber]